MTNNSNKLTLEQKNNSYNIFLNDEFLGCLSKKTIAKLKLNPTKTLNFNQILHLKTAIKNIVFRLLLNY